MNSKSKTKLTKLIQQMHQHQINHLKKHLNALEKSDNPMLTGVEGLENKLI
ncbi:MAG: hypothetical protein ACKPKO_48715 [Candidatus Fonsibacter sp.]